MHSDSGERGWAVSTLEVAGRLRFQIVYGEEATAETDPVAINYRSGNLSHLSTLLDLALVALAPGDHVLDLGAHLGGFALTAAALGCTVLAIEASPRNAGLLRLSATRNRFQKLEVIQAAVADQPGSVEFSVHGPFGHVATQVTGMPSITVPMATVDELLGQRRWDKVQFIKMDIEGSEVRAIRGMQRLLQRPDAPVIFFESNQYTLNFYGHTDADLKSELRRLGYTIYDVSTGKLLPVGAEQPQPTTLMDYLAAKRLPRRLANWGKTSGSLLERLGRLLDFRRRSA